jgi:hypothetical protein
MCVKFAADSYSNYESAANFTHIVTRLTNMLRPRVFYTYLSIPPGIRGLFQQSGGFLIAKYTCNALDKVQDQLLKNMLCHRKISFFLDNEV